MDICAVLALATKIYSSKKYNSNKRSRLFILSSSIHNTVSTPTLSYMPRLLVNALPASVLWFGTTQEDEILFSFLQDRCAVINTGSLLIYMYIITTYLHILKSYEKFDYTNAF